MAIQYSWTFILRKLHQLTGVVPLGIFFFVHMFTNAKALNGEESFEKAVADIHAIPFLLLLEIFGIFIPLLFHSIYGVIISMEARPNVGPYPYARNWFYIMQRATGIFLFVFLTFHILNLRFGLIPWLNMDPVAGNADMAFDIVAREFAIPWVLFVYILGVAATAWHLAYGFWLFAVDWGMVIGERAQKYALYACVALAAGLFAVGTNAAVAFIRPCGLMPQFMCEVSEEYTPAKRVEARPVN
jgi:succinate dehydrogenase/fumarate reductase cytochrome b subunit (b558 family)